MDVRRTVRRTALSRLLPVVLVAGLVAAMVLDTTVVSPDEAAAANPQAFDAADYAAETFPQVATEIEGSATDLAELAPAVAADPDAAAEQYGRDIGSGKIAYAVTATGTVAEADADFATLTVPGVPDGTTVRVPLGAAVSGTPIRDVTGTISFSDFVGQTDFQSVANQFKQIVIADVLGTVDVAALQGKQLTVVGASVSGGPPGSWLIQPVRLEVTG